MAALFAPAPVQATPGSIEIATRPALSSIRPLKDPVQLTFRLAHAPDGIRPDTAFHIRLLAPLPGTLWSTDFPLIEGTELLNVRLPAPRGVASLQYIFPIRGSYQVEISANRDGAKRTVSLHIKENRAKLAFLAAFLIGLFFLGFIAGRVFTGGGNSVSMLVLVCLILAPHGLGQENGPAQRARGRIEVSPARVGTPSRIRWSLPGEAREQIDLTIGITQEEKGREVFRLEKLNPRGPFEFQFQFFDASPHRVRAVASVEGEPPVVAERVVTVTAPDPPRWELSRAILYFLFVVAAGLLLGRLSRRRRGS